MNHNLCEKFFSVLADRNRIKIISELLTGDKSVTQIHTCLGIEQSLASHHLRALRECGFVTLSRKGKEHIYSLNTQTMKPIMEIMKKHSERFCPASCDCCVKAESGQDSEEHEILSGFEGLAKELSEKPTGDVLSAFQELRREVEGHFRFEEKTVFPPILKASQQDADLVRSLLIEHKIMRRLVERIEGLLVLGMNDDSKKIEESIRELIVVFKSHMQKEEDVLIPRARKALGKEQFEAVSALHSH